MRIIIVGAGLGGLAAAYCFARKGHDVQLLERRRELSNKGGGVSIRPGATRVLIAWGLKEQFEAVSDDFKTTYLRDQHTGEIINSTIAVETSEWPDWGTERQNIQQIFYRSAVNAGATISMNCQAEDVNEGTSEASVTLKNGSVLLADLVLVTDGIRSRLRSIVLQDNSEATAPLPSDVTLYGIKVPLQEARRDQALATVCQDTNLNVSFGRDSFIVFRANEKLQNWGGLFGIKGVTDQQGLWDEVGTGIAVQEVAKLVYRKETSAMSGKCSLMQTLLWFLLSNWHHPAIDGDWPRCPIFPVGPAKEVESCYLAIQHMQCILMQHKASP